MPRALIAGLGYLGCAVADRLVATRWGVEGWTLSNQTARDLARKGYVARRVDISNSSEVAAQSGEFDLLIHCASTRGGDADSYRCVYVDGAQNLINRFRNAQILFVSSTSVYGQTAGEWINEESPAQPQHENGKVLRQAEALVIENGGVVLRLGGIYGPGRSALLEKFLNGHAMLDPNCDRFVNQIHRDDAADAIVRVIEHGVSGQIYNVVDNEPILQSNCYRWLAKRLSRAEPPSGRLSSRRKRGQSNKRVSNAKLRGLGWTPRFPTFAAGMEKILSDVASAMA